jgi:hypothetical protein
LCSWSFGIDEVCRVLSSRIEAKNIFFSIFKNIERCMQKSSGEVVESKSENSQTFLDSKLIKIFSFFKSDFGEHKIFTLISAGANREKKRLQGKKL